MLFALQHENSTCQGLDLGDRWFFVKNVVMYFNGADEDFQWVTFCFVQHDYAIKSYFYPFFIIPKFT